MQCLNIFLEYFRGMRSGTVPHVLAVGLGSACEISQKEMEVCS